MADSDLTITKVVDDANPPIGNTITFLITATNLGPDAAQNVLVHDLLGSGFLYSTHVASQGTYDPSTGVWLVGPLGILGSETLEIDVVVQGNPANYYNIATISSDSFDPSIGGDPRSNGATIQVIPQGVVLTQSEVTLQSKIVDNPNPVIGTNVTFLITASASIAQNDNIIVFDLLPPGYTFVSANPSVGTYDDTTGIWSIGTLTTAIVTLEIVATVLPPPNNYINIAAISGENMTSTPLSWPFNTYAVQLVPMCPVITISPAFLPGAQIGVFYNHFVTASGGTAPYSYAVTSGILPPVLTLNPITGQITGNAVFNGVYPFTITATDVNGCMGSQDYIITVSAFGPGGPVTKSFSPTSVPVGTPSTLTISIANTGNTTITGISFTDLFPPGLEVAPIPNLTNNMFGAFVPPPSPGDVSLNFTGGSIPPLSTGIITIDVISNTAGSYPNNTGPVASNLGNLGQDVATLTVTDVCPPITVAPPTMPDGVVGVPYGPIPIGSSGGTPPYVLSPQGILFPGVSLVGATVSGVPTTAGIFTFDITTTDANGCTGFQQYTITITGSPLPPTPKKKRRTMGGFASYYICIPKTLFDRGIPARISVETAGNFYAYSEDNINYCFTNSLLKNPYSITTTPDLRPGWTVAWVNDKWIITKKP